MPKRYAVVVNGLVKNVVLWDADAQPDFQPEQGELVLCENIFVDLDYVWDGTQFLPPSQ